MSPNVHLSMQINFLMKRIYLMSVEYFQRENKAKTLS